MSKIDPSKNTSQLSLGERLTFLMNDLNFSKGEFCEATGISLSTLYRYEKGEREFKPKTIVKICELLNITTDYFLTGIPSDGLTITEKECLSKLNQMPYQTQQRYLGVGDYFLASLNNKIPQKEYVKRVPILGYTACGEPIQTIECYNEILETENISADYALIAEGDSMEPLIHDGSLILIKQQDNLENGEIGIFQINRSGFSDDEEVTCKKFSYDPQSNIIALKPLNEDYNDIYISLNENTSFKIIGKFLEVV